MSMLPAKEAANVCIQALGEHKILVCGNGGSAAMASHFAAELVVRYRKERCALPCICLNADAAILTACANDYGFEYIFERQVEAFGNAGDVLIALSTSGKSKNVLRAIAMAERMHMTVIEAPRVEGMPVSAVQEVQLAWIHNLAELIEDHYAT